MAETVFYVEPLNLIDALFGSTYAEGMQRIISYQTRSPGFPLIGQRLPQTLIVIGTAYLVGVMIALPIGIHSAYRQYSWFDQLGTAVAMIGFSVPTFFTGTLIIIIFAVWLGWFPTKYDTTLQVTDWASFWKQIRQMAMPMVTVIALGIPAIFGGAIHANDLPMAQTLTFIFAILIVSFNLIADVLYRLLDPRIRYD